MGELEVLKMKYTLIHGKGPQGGMSQSVNWLRKSVAQQDGQLILRQRAKEASPPRTLVGRRATRCVFEDGDFVNFVHGVIREYFDASGESPPLWTMEHDDGDSEDLERNEAICAVRLYEAGRHRWNGTIDDAAGEAFDKVANMLGLPYPGGPAVSAAAEGGDPERYRFPRAFLRDTGSLDFSFSGLKTAVRYELAGPGKVDFQQLQITPGRVADICASFQEAVVDCLVGKAMLALEKTGEKRLCVGGGVAANTRLRERLTEAAGERDLELWIAPLALCTDNAVMGAIALERLQAGLTESLDLDVQPGLVR